jgi:N6-L-threonylcarbamoyladenine synthase
MLILGIETSCDETAISTIEADGGFDNPNFKILGSAVNSQIEIHKPYGGVFPTLAKREHQKNLPIVLDLVLKEAIIDLSKIDLITVTVGPGLEPSLWTGIEFAKKIGQKLNIPIIGTNHMEGHLASVLLNNKKVEFPAIGLLISGGHTELIYLKNWIEKEKIGETKDDAVGEAFDKVARMLGLSYPGGPEISKLAEKARTSKLPALSSKLPRPMIHSGDLNFSFSGLKTAVLYYIKGLTLPNPSLKLREGPSMARGGELSDSQKMQIAREFEDAVVETLIYKTKKAIEKYLPKTLIVGGGVIANKVLRENFLNLKNNYSDLEVFIPEKSLTTDNAVMIATAGYFEYLKNKDQKALVAKGNLEI